MVEYDYSGCVISIDTNKILEMIDKINNFESNRVKECYFTTIRTSNTTVIKYCKENNISFSFDYKDILTVEFSCSIDASRDDFGNSVEEYNEYGDISNEASDIINSELCKVVNIIEKYETFVY